MEDQSAVDISIRKVAVRLNDSNIDSQMNGECDSTLYIPSSGQTESSCLKEAKSIKKHSVIATDLEEKLHICNDPSEPLVNGCSKLLHEEIQNINFSKCNNSPSYEIINTDQIGKPVEKSQTDQVSERTTAPALVEEQFLKDFSVVLPLKNSYDITAGQDETITYLGYESESQMPDIMRLIQKDLSEPYSIYTYRYFIHNWPKLCFLAQDGNHTVGAIVCKLDAHKKLRRRGYIAMLAVDEKYRKKKIGSHLVLKAIQAMNEDAADEVVLETEITNKPALRLYENLGFVRDKRLFRYYLNGVDALRLKLWLK
ncbi:hypothetical protein JTE90_024810 [Oedothorax gibbosus]|uniref:N-terminal methionine N(alpha)-acetyltransferase NatC n=1 Tax=Oedothorax gibbosus TaxID=931172 RepID=A0AAV6URC6_9ARAC|nr:hypothetical protein JTE90_024810 [Oedothorax gibbosus]